MGVNELLRQLEDERSNSSNISSRILEAQKSVTKILEETITVSKKRKNDAVTSESLDSVSQRVVDVTYSKLADPKSRFKTTFINASDEGEVDFDRVTQTILVEVVDLLLAEDDTLTVATINEATVEERISMIAYLFAKQEELYNKYIYLANS